MSVTPHQPPFPRVIKTLPPPPHGTLELKRRDGEALLCVGCRESALGQRYCTTIEPMVDERPRQLPQPEHPEEPSRVAKDEAKGT